MYTIYNRLMHILKWICYILLKYTYSKYIFKQIFLALRCRLVPSGTCDAGAAPAVKIATCLHV